MWAMNCIGHRWPGSFGQPKLQGDLGLEAGEWLRRGRRGIVGAPLGWLPRSNTTYRAVRFRPVTSHQRPAFGVDTRRARASACFLPAKRARFVDYRADQLRNASHIASRERGVGCLHLAMPRRMLGTVPSPVLAPVFPRLRVV